MKLQKILWLGSNLFFRTFIVSLWRGNYFSKIQNRPVSTVNSCLFLFVQFSQLYSCCNKIYNSQWRDWYLWGCSSKYLFSRLRPEFSFIFYDEKLFAGQLRYIVLDCNLRKVINTANLARIEENEMHNWFNCILSARNYSTTSSLFVCACCLNNAGRLAKTNLEKLHVNSAWYEGSRWIKLKLPPVWSGHISDYNLPAS